jgi:Lon protease-like protein
MTLPLRIFEPRYLQMIDECVKGDSSFGVVLIKDGQEVGGAAVPHEVGTVARILGVEKKARGQLHITTVGEERFRVRRILRTKPYLVGEVEPFPMEKQDAPEIGVLIGGEIDLLSVYLDLLSQVSTVQIQLQRSLDDPETLAYFIAMLLQVPLSLKQSLLAAADLPTLLEQEATLLRADVTALTILLHSEEVLEVSADSLFSSN